MNTFHSFRLPTFKRTIYYPIFFKNVYPQIKLSICYDNIIGRSNLIYVPVDSELHSQR